MSVAYKMYGPFRLKSEGGCCDVIDPPSISWICKQSVFGSHSGGTADNCRC